MSLGARFKEAVENIKFRDGLQIKEICEKIGISPSSLSQYFTGAVNPKLETVKLLSKMFDVNYDYVLTGVGSVFNSNETDIREVNSLLKHIAEIDLYETPVYANAGTVLSLDEYIVGTRKVSFKHPISNPENFGSLIVSGSSMNLEGIFEGDVVIFRKSNEARNNQLVVIRMNGQLMVKFYKTNNDKVEFHSNDGKTEPLFQNVDDCCEIIGIVVNVIKEY